MRAKVVAGYPCSNEKRAKKFFNPCSLNNNKPCFYCSHEETTRPYTRIEKDSKTGIFKPVGLGRKHVDLGEFCNNACSRVAGMHYCPARWERMKKGTIAK